MIANAYDGGQPLVALASVSVSRDSLANGFREGAFGTVRPVYIEGWHRY